MSHNKIFAECIKLKFLGLYESVSIKSHGQAEVLKVFDSSEDYASTVYWGTDVPDTGSQWLARYE